MITILNCHALGRALRDCPVALELDLAPWVVRSLVLPVQPLPLRSELPSRGSRSCN